MLEGADTELPVKGADRDWKGIAAAALYLERGGGGSDGSLSTERLSGINYAKSDDYGIKRNLCEEE